MLYGIGFGSQNDIQLWYASDFGQHPTRYVGNSLILFDGILNFCRGPLLCPIRNPNTQAEVMYNLLQREARVIIENKFAWTKRLSPIVGLKYNLHLDSIGLVYHNCVLLTNVIIIHQSPMRADN